MAELFDAQRESAALQGGIARLRTAHGKQILFNPRFDLVHTNPEGDIVDRAGKILIAKLEPFTAAKGKK